MFRKDQKVSKNERKCSTWIACEIWAQTDHWVRRYRQINEKYKLQYEFFLYKKNAFSKIHFSPSFVSIRASRHTKCIATIAGNSFSESISSHKMIFLIWEEFSCQIVDQSRYDCLVFCKGKCSKLGFSYDNNMRSLFKCDFTEFNFFLLCWC